MHTFARAALTVRGLASYLPRMEGPLLTLPGLVLLGACNGWPAWQHLDPPSGAVPADEDPRADVDVTWSPTDANGDPQPPGHRVDLTEGAVLVTGTLRGVGWSDAARPVLLGNPACGHEGVRPPIEGDWLGEVEVFEVVSPGGRLCVRLAAGDAETGLDLLVARLDPCGVPVGWWPVDDDPGGLGGVGPVIGWSTEVPADVHVSVIVAAYAPTDLARTVPFTLGISAPDGDLCPLLPSEGT